MVEVNAALRVLGVPAPQPASVYPPTSALTSGPAPTASVNTGADDVDLDRLCTFLQGWEMRTAGVWAAFCTGEQTSWRHTGHRHHDKDKKLKPKPLVIPCISPDFPHKLVALKKPADLTSLGILNILGSWSTTTTAGTPSLYSQLFLTHNLLGIDILFAADASGSYLSAPKIVDHVPTLLAAFQIKIKDFNDLMGTNFIDSGMSADLTIENVSMIYRYVLLARVLGIKPFCSLPFSKLSSSTPSTL